MVPNPSWSHILDFYVNAILCPEISDDTNSHYAVGTTNGPGPNGIFLFIFSSSGSIYTNFVSTGVPSPLALIYKINLLQLEKHIIHT